MSYYVHPKASTNSTDAKYSYYIPLKRLLRVRGDAFLAVKACLMVFDGFCRGLFFGVFGELSLFCGVLRLQICDSVWSGLAALNSLHLVHCGWRGF